MNEQSFRLRIDYGKTDRLRHLSHLELMRALERVIRRSGLPFSLSKGFNVHLKHAFGPALPVGTAGLHELMDLWLTSYIPPEEACAKLARATVPSLPINEVWYTHPKTPSIQKSHIFSLYEVRIANLNSSAITCFENTLAQIIAEGSLEVMKKNKPVTIDLTSQIAKPLQFRKPVHEDDDLAVEISLRANERGVLRPSALITAALERGEVGGEKNVPLPCLPTRNSSLRITSITRLSLTEEL